MNINKDLERIAKEIKALNFNQSDMTIEDYDKIMKNIHKKYQTLSQSSYRGGHQLLFENGTRIWIKKESTNPLVFVLETDGNPPKKQIGKFHSYAEVSNMINRILDDPLKYSAIKGEKR